jgi:hypothetical protein
MLFQHISSKYGRAWLTCMSVHTCEHGISSLFPFTSLSKWILEHWKLAVCWFLRFNGRIHGAECFDTALHVTVTLPWFGYKKANPKSRCCYCTLSTSYCSFFSSVFLSISFRASKQTNRTQKTVSTYIYVVCCKRDLDFLGKQAKKKQKLKI